MRIKRGDRFSFPSGIGFSNRIAQQLLIALEPSDPLDWESGIGNWFIEAPGESPVWQHYMLSAVHLRPIENVKAAHLRFPGATHEFMLVAMDPVRKPDPLNPETWSFLLPVNLSEQVALPNDSEASMLLRRCAEAVTKGVLWAEPLFSGMVEPWRSFLNAQASDMDKWEAQNPPATADSPSTFKTKT